MPGNLLTFNNISYDVNMYIYNSDVSLTAADVASSKNAKPVFNENILYIMLENSFDDCVPKAEFEIQDVLFGISNTLKSQNCRIFFSIAEADRRECRENSFDILSQRRQSPFNE